MTKLTIKVKVFEPDDATNKALISLLHHLCAYWSTRGTECVYEEDGQQCDVILLNQWAYPPASKKFNIHAEYNKEVQSSLWQSCGSMPLRLFLTGEASDFSATPFLRYFFDGSISFNPSSATNLFFSIPVMQEYIYRQQPKYKLKAFFDKQRALYDYPKTRFCNYLFRHDGFDKPNRTDFFKILSAYKPIDAPGLSCHNMDIELKDYEYDDGKQEKLTFMSHYKFTIAFENQSLNHMDYFTEKIMHPFFAGSVPIYYGCPNIERYFNPAAFINGHDYASFEDLAARVRQVDQDDRLYQSYLNAHPILDNSALYTIDKDMSVFIEKLVTRIERAHHLKGLALIFYRLKRAIGGAILRIWYRGVRLRFDSKMFR